MCRFGGCGVGAIVRVRGRVWEEERGDMSESWLVCVRTLRGIISLGLTVKGPVSYIYFILVRVV